MLIAQPESIQEVLVSAVRALGVRMDYRNARFEAELLLSHALGVSRAGLLARLADPLDQPTAARFAGMVARRAQGEPVAYILGHKEFYGLDLVLDRRVLIPRPETELLVELALQTLKHVSHPAPVVADVGTGSGAIALAMAAHAPSARIIATDISPDALAVAQLNAGRLHLEDRIQFVLCDLVEAVGEQIDLLLANLPYIPLERFEQLPREIRHFEPRIALVGGLEGLSVIRRLLQQVQSHMTRAGIILLEISEEQGQAAVELAQGFFPWANIALHQDLEELDRVVEIQLAGT